MKVLYQGKEIELEDPEPEEETLDQLTPIDNPKDPINKDNTQEITIEELYAMNYFGDDDE